MKKLYLFAFTMLSALGASAQRVTMDHDVTKMNQITIQEIGVGAFTPEAWYVLAHNRYRQTAHAMNKNTLRGAAGLSAYSQLDHSERVDSAMSQRARIEALNMLDREIDLAWQTESSKVEGKLADFERNINRLMTVGGSNPQVKLWRLEYNKYQTAIRAVRESYMPNSQRKKQYLRIYEELRAVNENLIKLLVYLNANQRRSELLACRYTKPDNVQAISTSAMNRWRGCAMNVLPNSKPNQGGITIGPGKPTVPDKEEIFNPDAGILMKEARR